ncbi:MAG: ABC transporter permease, partial [Actinobacteria bacterium]|nr:ABC transporter permease [Actinomycetota bacterium]
MRSIPGRHWRSSLRPVATLSTPGVLLVLLLIVSAFVSPQLFSLSGLGGALGEATPLILSVLAIMPIALSAPAAIDLSIGPLIVFVNVGIVHWLVPNGIGGPLPSFAFAILAGVAFEVLQGAVINVVRLQPVIVTLSGYLVLGGLNLIVLPQAGGTVPYWLGNLGSPTSIFSPALIVVAACFAGWGLLARTAFVRNLRLAGGNERAAFVSGVRLTTTRLGAHVVAGAIAGVAGVMLTGLLQSADPTAGSSQTLMAVTALVVGGVSLAGGQGRALGAFLGAVDVFLIGNVLGTFQLGEASSFVTEAAYGV